jgi:acetyl-CoA carboxylase carboxyltransferase component
MDQVQRASAKGQGKEVDESELGERTERFRMEVERDSEAYATSAALHDDGIIDPRDTRDVLGMCLEVVGGKGVEGAEAHRTLARL